MVDTRRREFGMEDMRTLHAMYDHAALLRSIGRADEAIRILEELMQVTERMHGGQYELLTMVTNCMANGHADLGHHQEAEAMGRAVFLRYEKKFGMDHESTLTAMVNLAKTLRSLGKEDEAEQLLIHVGIFQKP